MGNAALKEQAVTERIKFITTKKQEELTAAEKAEFLAFVGETIKNVIAIGTAVEIQRTTSETECLKWMEIYEMPLDYTTGKANIHDNKGNGFLDKIYSNFGDELLVARNENPAQHKLYTTISKEGYTMHPAEVVRAANGMKAMQSWLKENVDRLYYDEVEILDADGNVQLHPETKEPMKKHEPKFKAVATAEEKALTKFLKELADVENSPYITGLEKEQLKDIFKKISERLVPELTAAKAEHAAKLEALKPQAEEVAEAV